MRSAALACVALLVAVPTLGQSFGANVGGAVTDETGALVPGAAVPAGNINSSSFLRRTTARDARQIQWGLRYRF